MTTFHPYTFQDTMAIRRRRNDLASWLGTYDWTWYLTQTFKPRKSYSGQTYRLGLRAVWNCWTSIVDLLRDRYGSKLYWYACIEGEEKHLHSLIGEMPKDADVKRLAVSLNRGWGYAHFQRCNTHRQLRAYVVKNTGWEEDRGITWDIDLPQG